MRFTQTPITKIVASATVAAVLGLAGVSVAGAASTSSTPKAATATTAPATAQPGVKHPKAAAHLRHLRREAGVLAAKTIGIKPADLRKELLDGKTIAAIATEHGVAPQKVIDALVAGADKKIDAAVAAKKITPERAVKLKARAAKAIPRIVNDWHPKAKAAPKA